MVETGAIITLLFMILIMAIIYKLFNNMEKTKIYFTILLFLLGIYFFLYFK